MATSLTDIIDKIKQDPLGTLNDILGGAAGTAISIGGSKLLDEILGQSKDDILKPITDYQDTAMALDAGGLQGQLVDGVYTVTPTDSSRDNLVGDIQAGLGDYATELGSLREQLAPGFGALTKARVERLQNAKRKAVGDVRENLARRRVAGSSFASDAEARTAREFDVPIAEAAAQSFLEELQLSSNLLQMESEAQISSAKVALDELNTRLNLGLGASNQLTGAMANLAAAQANILASLAQESAKLQSDFVDNLLKSLGIK
tara:strand:+ start:2548 stop:3330 length:783 start_codon:yes stop_codon:yes gene_type:complete